MELVYFYFLLFSCSFMSAEAINCTMDYHHDGSFVRGGERVCDNGICEIHYKDQDGFQYYHHNCAFTKNIAITPNAGDKNPVCIHDRIPYANATLGTWNRIVCQCNANLCNAAGSPLQREMAKKMAAVTENSIKDEIIPIITSSRKPPPEYVPEPKSTVEAKKMMISLFVLVAVNFL